MWCDSRSRQNGILLGLGYNKYTEYTVVVDDVNQDPDKY